MVGWVVAALEKRREIVRTLKGRRAAAVADAW